MSIPLRTSRDLDALIEDIGDRNLVLLGEASHGTHEYYTWRSAISKRLISEKKFSFVAVEGDWPDCFRINRYVKQSNESPATIREVLSGFDRWPTWMWANWEVAAFAEWLCEENKPLPADKKSGFYGLDVYSLWDSMNEIVKYLQVEDPATADTVKKAIQCFEPYGNDEHLYARYSLKGHSCRDRVVALLREVRARSRFPDGDREAGFNTEQNALIAVNAEKYYRSMVGFDNQSWNVRDTHMMETLFRLMDFHGKEAKGIVWAHNTHVGDARATDMKRAGMINIGQLAREELGINQVYLVGFGSYSGQVIAGEEWGSVMEEMDVPPARESSIEWTLHQENQGNRYFLFNNEETRKKFIAPVRHRAIGVVYQPYPERSGNYVLSHMAERYDSFIFLDQTSAVHPLHMQPSGDKIPETYPFGT